MSDRIAFPRTDLLTLFSGLGKVGLGAAQI